MKNPEMESDTKGKSAITTCQSQMFCIIAHFVLKISSTLVAMNRNTVYFTLAIYIFA